ncbi:MAG: tetraacyldisaccharide 4'-kinase, partial [Pseudomonadota bacterium]
MNLGLDLYTFKPGLWRRFLAGVYGLAIGFRLRLKRMGWLRARRLPAWVISVGNLTVGGAGKTPAVKLLAEWLKDSGYRVAVLSRGYRREDRESINVVSDGTDLLLGPRQAGDEPYLLARSLPGVPV